MEISVVEMPTGLRSTVCVAVRRIVRNSCEVRMAVRKIKRTASGVILRTQLGKNKIVYVNDVTALAVDRNNKVWAYITAGGDDIIVSCPLDRFELLAVHICFFRRKILSGIPDVALSARHLDVYGDVAGEGPVHARTYLIFQRDPVARVCLDPDG